MCPCLCNIGIALVYFHKDIEHTQKYTDALFWKPFYQRIYISFVKKVYVFIYLYVSTKYENHILHFVDRFQ